MRPLILVPITLTIIAGIPLLASQFRKDSAGNRRQVGEVVANSQGAGQKVASAALALQAPEATSAAEPPAARLVPVSLQPAQLPPASALPMGEEELIAAIQNELNRLGYYDGPRTGRWSRTVRAAARQFVRQTGGRSRHLHPTAALLAALQAANPEIKQVASGRRESVLPAMPSVPPASPALNAGHANESAPKDNVLAPEAAKQNDDYLPPWMKPKALAGRGVTVQPGVRPSAPRIAAQESGAASEETAEVSGRARHKRHRASRGARERGRYASYRGSSSRRSRQMMYWPGF